MYRERDRKNKYLQRERDKRQRTNMYRETDRQTDIQNKYIQRETEGKKIIGANDS